MTMLLRGGLVLDVDGVRAANVLVEADRIVAVEAKLPVPEGTEVWELDGDLVMPGLINAHHHSTDNLNTGRLPIAPLELWSLASVPSRPGSPEELRLAALLSAAQMLRGGVTAVVDVVRPAPALTVDGLEAVAGAYAESGLRAAVAPVVVDLPVEHTLPLDDRFAMDGRPAGDGAAQLAVVEAFFEQWHGRSGRIRVQVAPSGPQRCSDRLLSASIELTRRLGTQLHTHALETAPQAEQARRRWGVPMLRHLERVGALGPDTVLAHLVWPESDEIELLAATRTIVVHNPASNCALGSGRAPLTDLLAADVRLALGTDAATCNDGLSMFEAMKLATILHRPFEPDWRRWPTPCDAIRLATEGGAAALGLAGQLGRVAPGYLADLVVLDAGTPALVPPNHLMRQIVMRGGPDLVRHVLVAGRPLVRDRELLTLDWRALADAARTVTAGRPPLGPTDEQLGTAIGRMLTRIRSSSTREATS